MVCKAQEHKLTCKAVCQGGTERPGDTGRLGGRGGEGERGRGEEGERVRGGEGERGRRGEGERGRGGGERGEGERGNKKE